MKRLYKDNSNKMLTGVLGGVGRYINVDPIIVRLGFILITLVTAIFPMALLYLIAVFMVPDEEPPHVIDVD